jgi:hypothetical protein
MPASLLPAFTLVSCSAYSSNVPPKRLLTFNGLHGVISQKILHFIATALRTSDLTLINISDTVGIGLDRRLFNDAMPTGKVPIECEWDHQCWVRQISERCKSEALEISLPLLTPDICIRRLWKHPAICLEILNIRQAPRLVIRPNIILH